MLIPYSFMREKNMETIVLHFEPWDLGCYPPKKRCKVCWPLELFLNILKVSQANGRLEPGPLRGRVSQGFRGLGFRGLGFRGLGLGIEGLVLRGCILCMKSYCLLAFAGAWPSLKEQRTRIPIRHARPGTLRCQVVLLIPYLVASQNRGTPI